MRRLLILGGTAEAAALAAAATEHLGDRLEIISSLAGRTARPAAVAGAVRTGGFGGAEGLAIYLRDAGIDLLCDATHPFAAKVSAHARAAAAATAVPRLVLGRPPWPRQPADRWIEVDGAEGAAAALPDLGNRVFLTLGRRGLAAFAGLAEAWFLVRLVEPPPAPPPLPRHTLILDRGPFAPAAERALMAHHRIEVLVTKASGGPATAAKIEAARALGLPVVMLRRPPPEPGPRVESVAAAVAWLEARLAALDSGERAGP